MTQDEYFFRGAATPDPTGATPQMDDAEDEGIGDAPGLVAGATAPSSGTAAPLTPAQAKLELSLADFTVEQRIKIRENPVARRVLEDLERTFENQAARGTARASEKVSERALEQLASIRQKLDKLSGDLAAPKTVDPVTALTSTMGKMLEAMNGATAASGPQAARAAAPASPEADTDCFKALVNQGVDSAEIDADLEQLHAQTREQLASDDAVGAVYQQAVSAQLDAKRRAGPRETSAARADAIITQARAATERRVHAVLHAAPEGADGKAVSVELAWDRRSNDGQHTRSVESARFVIDSELSFPEFGANFIDPGVQRALKAWARAATPHGRQQAAALLTVIEELQPERLLALHPFMLTSKLLHAIHDAAFTDPDDAQRAYDEFRAVERADGAGRRSASLAISSVEDPLRTVQKHQTGVPSFKRDGADALFAWAGVKPSDFGPGCLGPTAVAVLHLHRHVAALFLPIAVALNKAAQAKSQAALAIDTADANAS